MMTEYYAKELSAGRLKRCEFLCADAAELCFRDDVFDVIVCIQNGICAFGVDHRLLLKEALRVTRNGGTLLFSTYSDKFWEHRLKWFEAQSAEGLLGKIDYSLTGDGEIVCKDPFVEDFTGLRRWDEQDG